MIDPTGSGAYAERSRPCSTMTDQLPPTIGGKYRTIRQIGRGGMGVVYEVEHEHTGERLALKVLSAESNASGESVSRFKREARASAQIKSDHVVRVTDADVDDELGGVPFLVMELLEGADLERTCAGQPQPPHLVVEWLRQVARGLDKAHRLGLVHRDLKPENLFLTRREDGTPLLKILDFGIVKHVAHAGTTTQGGQFLGTPLYMAPEQAAGSEYPITPAADRYTLGLVAFRLLTGAHFRQGDNLIQVLRDLTATSAPLPSARGATLGAAFDSWFARACAPVPEQRFSSAAEQIEALALALGLPARTLESSSNISDSSLPPGADISLAPTLGATSAPRSTLRSRSRTPAYAIALLLATATAAGGWLLMNRTSAPSVPGSAAASVSAEPTASAVPSGSPAPSAEAPSQSAAAATPSQSAPVPRASASVSPARPAQPQPRHQPPKRADDPDPLADQK